MQCDDIQHLASTVRRSRCRCAKFPSFRSDADLADDILAALADGKPLPSTRSFRGSDFTEIDAAAAFVSAERIDSIRYERLETHRHGEAILSALEACEELDEDWSHWNGPHGELLDMLVFGEAPPRLAAVRAENPFNPVALFTPRTDLPLAAVATVDIAASEPIAPYWGELVAEDDPLISESAYLFELDPDALSARGYEGPRVGLRVDAARRGSLARFVNDATSFGLPARSPNSFLELIFDGERREFVVMLFASEAIRKGQEVIVDYGPDYWAAALAHLLKAHAGDAAGAGGGKSKRKR